MTVLETDRLVLRRLTPEDAEFMLGLLNEDSFLEFVGDRGVRTIEDARQYIVDGPMRSYAQNGFGLFLIELKASLEAIGICGLLKRDSLDDVDIGFALIPEFWGNGYASESAAAVLDYAKMELGLDRVVAITTPDNVASIRVLEKLGMVSKKRVQLTEGGPALQLFAEADCD